jgi:YVTN family beta-propeller protein
MRPVRLFDGPMSAAPAIALALFLPVLPFPLEAEPATTSIAVAFKLAPPDALVVESGRELSLGAARNGIRLAMLRPGDHALLLIADGCIAKRITIHVAASGTTPLVEEKLERCGSPLAFAGQGRTGFRPKSVSYTPDGRFLVLPLLSGRGADVLDSATFALSTRLSPPAGYAKSEGFVESAFFPALREIWVSQMHNSMIHVFDLDSFAYKASFPSGGSYPKVILPSLDGERAYVSNWVSEDISIIDARSRRLVRRIPVGGTPRGLALSPDGRFLYIARFSDGAILKLRLADMKLETMWAADGGAKRHLVFDPRRGRLYATDMDRGSLFVLDARSGLLLAELALGPNPNGCALSSDGRIIYACTRGPNGVDGYEKKGPVAGELIAIDAARLTVVARQWGGNQPTGLAVSPGGIQVVFTDFLDHRVESYRLDAAFLDASFGAKLSPQ